MPWPRQAVGAIEAGHHNPSVDAAVAIARAVSQSVKALFRDAAAPQIERQFSRVPADLEQRVGWLPLGRRELLQT